VLSKKFIFILLSMFLIAGQSIQAQTGRATRYEPGDWVTYASFQYITSFEEGNKYVFIGTTNGVLRYNLISAEWEDPYTLGFGLEDPYVLNLYWNEQSRELWVFTKGGVDVIFTVRNTWKHIEGSATVFQNSGRSLSVGRAGNSIYAKDNRGLHKFNDMSHSYSGLSSQEPNGIRWKQRDQMSAGSDIPNFVLDGLWSFNRQNRTLENETFQQYPLTVRYIDSEQNDWIGTWGAGVIKGDDVTNIAKIIRRGPISTPIGALYKQKNGFWFGGLSSNYSKPPAISGEPGISFWNQNKDTWMHFTPEVESDIRDATIYNIDGDSYGVWFGTDRGLIYYSLQNRRWHRMDKSHLRTVQVYDVLVQDTSVFVATRAGLYRLSNPGGEYREQIPIENKDVLATYSLVEHQGRIFVGTDDGLVAFDPKEKKLYYYNDDGLTVPMEQFQFFRVYNVTANRDYVYYVNDYGLFQLNIETKQQKQLPKLGLYARSVVRVIQADPNSLWVGLENGLGQYDIAAGEWWFYTSRDGLASNLVYDIVVDSHYIWCATASGATRFNYINYKPMQNSK